MAYRGSFGRGSGSLRRRRRRFVSGTRKAVGGPGAPGAAAGTGGAGSPNVLDAPLPVTGTDPAFHKAGRTWQTPEETRDLVRAGDLIRAGDFAAAASVLADLALRSPDLAEAHFNLGVALRGAGRTEDAARELRRAAELLPRWEMPWLALGRLCYEEGRAEQALAACRMAVDLGSKHPDAFLVLGLSLKQLGRASDALAAFQVLLRIAPASPEAHFQAGMALRMLGREREAHAQFRMTLGIDPVHTGALQSIAQRPEGMPLAEQKTDGRPKEPPESD